MTAAPITPELADLITSIPDADWDKRLIEQAIYLFAEDGRAFSMNTFRDLLPSMAHGVAGRVFLSLLFRKDSPIEEVGTIRSTSPDTHRKRIDVYVLTDHGRQRAQQWHEQWTAARPEAAA